MAREPLTYNKLYLSDEPDKANCPSKWNDQTQTGIQNILLTESNEPYSVREIGFQLSQLKLKFEELFERLKALLKALDDEKIKRLFWLFEEDKKNFSLYKEKDVKKYYEEPTKICNAVHLLLIVENNNREDKKIIKPIGDESPSHASDKEDGLLLLERSKKDNSGGYNVQGPQKNKSKILKDNLKSLQTTILDLACSGEWDISFKFFKSSKKVFDSSNAKVEAKYKNLMFKNFPTHINKIMLALSAYARGEIDCHQAYKTVLGIAVKAAHTSRCSRSYSTMVFYHVTIFEILGIDVEVTLQNIYQAIKNNQSKFNGEKATEYPRNIEEIIRVIESKDYEGRYAIHSKLQDILSTVFAVSENSSRSQFTKNFYDNFLDLLVIHEYTPVIEAADFYRWRQAPKSSQ